jgi:hypothetical protein
LLERLTAYAIDRNSPGFDPSILQHSGIWGAADEAVLNIVHRKKFNYGRRQNLANHGSCLIVWTPEFKVYDLSTDGRH